MILHTLSASPTSAAFNDCLRVVTDDDAILLIGDGVYAALPETAGWNTLQATGIKVFVLDCDAAAAGVPLLPGIISPVDMDGFVELTERFARQQAWY